MKYKFIYLFCIFSINTFSQNYFKKFKDLDKQTVSVVGDDFILEVDIISPENERKIKPYDTRMYSWYSSNQIQNTQGGYDSRLLHGDYVSKYINKNLKEKGQYKYGLKKGTWKQWFENGQLKSITKWKNGQLNGQFIQYDQNNFTYRTGKYKNGQLNGTIIQFKNGDVESIDKYLNGIKQSKKSKEIKSSNKIAKEKITTRDKKLDDSKPEKNKLLDKIKKIFSSKKNSNSESVTNKKVKSDKK